MDFNSLRFVAFFPCAVAICYAMPRVWRNAYLLVVSALFYGLWHPLGAVYMFWAIAVSYLAAWAVDPLSTASVAARRTRMVLAVIALLLPLLGYKLFGPTDGVLRALLSAVGVGQGIAGLNWAIPVGMSTFSLQAAGYVIDVWKGRTIREASPVRHGLYLCFFPTVLSGPINRSFDLMPQLRSNSAGFRPDMAMTGTKLLIWGMFLKVAVADRTGVYVDSVLWHAGDYNGFTLVFAQLCFLFQMYTDFAGYSCIAIGCGRLLGFDIKPNFRRPFFAVGMGQYWRRWHMALSGWLRDYVYIPLGGNRCGPVRRSFNTIVTFLASGLWHGGSPGYLLWGLAHGVIVSVERFLPLERWARRPWLRWPLSLITCVVYGLLLLPFHATWQDLLQRICTHFGPWSLKLPSSVHATGTLLTIALMFVLVMAKDANDEFGLVDVRSRAVRMLAYAALVVLILIFGVVDASQFIYVSF